MAYNAQDQTRKPQGVSAQDEKKTQGVSRRELLTKVGAGTACVMAGGVVGYAAKPGKEVLPVQDTWMGRNIADCTGCRICQVSCSLKKENRIQPGIARITVQQYAPGVEFPVACYQCGEGAKCVENCPTSALSIDGSNKLNTIVVDKTKCTRTAKGSDCTVCRDQCPGTAVTFHPKTKEPLICDLCGGDPECVKTCPEDCLSLRGVKMAAVAPSQIAAGLQLAYLPVKTPKRAFPVPATAARPAAPFVAGCDTRFGTGQVLCENGANGPALPGRDFAADAAPGIGGAAAAGGASGRGTGSGGR
jgi:anaerobic carbon-monoxide dehydrogenase iron sulfur subunit